MASGGRTPEELSREIDPTSQANWNLIRQADRGGGHRDDGLPSIDREKATRLRRENRQLCLERDILAKVASDPVAGPLQ